MSSPLSKRRRLESENLGASGRRGLQELKSKVLVEITNPLILKQFIEVISNLLSDVDFQIVTSPSFTGLEVATVNDTKTCMIQARFSNRIDTSDPEITNFCVSVTTLLKCLEIADVDQYVMFGIEEDIVRFEAIQPNTMLNGARLNIPRKISEQDQWLLEQQDFQFTMKFKQAFFRKHIRTLSRLQVNKVDFCLYRPYGTIPSPARGPINESQEENDTNYDIQNNPAIRNMYFAFRGDSDDVKDICIWFHSTTKMAENESDVTSMHQEQSRKLIGHTFVTVEENATPENTDVGLSHSPKKLVPNWDDMEELYRERFQTRYLEYFTKNIDRNDIILYMAPTLPLVLHFPVGDTSYIRFVLMMCEKDENDITDSRHVPSQ